MTDTPEALPPLLTDEQIAFCIYEARMESGTFKRDGTMSFRIARAVEKEVRAALAQRQQSASEAMPCGHHPSLLLKSAETGEPLYCELCDAQSGRRDAEQRESELAEANESLRAALAQRQQVPAITDAMVDAYLQANDAYWRDVDALPTDLTKPWRQGTPKEATRFSLAAALTAAPSAQVEPQVPLTEADVFSSDDIMAVNADAQLGMIVLMQLVRAIERAHRIGKQEL